MEVMTSSSDGGAAAMNSKISSETKETCPVSHDHLEFNPPDIGSDSPARAQVLGTFRCYDDDDDEQ